MEDLIAYKYRSFRSKNNREDFLANRLWFSDLSQMNDPFEGILPMQNIDEVSNEDIASVNIKIALHKNPQLASNAETMEKLNELFMAEAPDIRRNNCTEEHQAWAKQQITQLVYKNFGIYCLSRTPVNYMMWSHYADSHKGFCIGLDLVKLAEQLNAANLKPGCLVVDYMIDRPVYTFNEFNEENNKAYAQKYLATKGKLWEYEEELRIITTNLINQSFTYRPDTISEIVLGWKISHEDESAIISHIQDSAIKCRVYKVRPSEMKYEMGEERIL